jgi:hypothetical protein
VKNLLAAIVGLTLLAPAAFAAPRTEVIPLNHADPVEIAAVLNALYSDRATAIAYPPNNSLILSLQPLGTVAQPAAGQQQAPGQAWPGAQAPAAQWQGQWPNQMYAPQNLGPRPPMLNPWR